MKKIKSTAGAYATAAIICFAFIPGAHCQTLVPKLNQEGHKGDIARQAKERAARQFDEIDDDKDGKLSREEISRKLPYFEDRFDARDKDHDGFLSWEEFVGHDRWQK